MTKKAVYHNFSFVLIGRLSSTALSAIFYFIFAALLDPNTYGELSYIIAIAGTFSIISRFGLNYSVEVYRAKGNDVLANQINVLAIITTTVAAIILLFIDQFAALLMFAGSFFVMNQFNLLGMKKYKKFMYTLILKGFLLIIIPIFLYQDLGIQGIILGMAVAHLLLSFHFLTKLNRKLDSFREIKNNFKVLLHNFGLDLSSNLVRNVDKLLIVPLLGFTSTGVYQLNLQILFGLEVIPIALHSYLLAEESSGKKQNKISYSLLVVSIIVVILVILFSPFFITEIFPKYSDGIESLQVLSISLIPLTISSIFTAKLQSKESTKIGYSALVRIISLLVLIAVLGNIYGLMGLSFSVLISIILNTIFLAILYYRHK